MNILTKICVVILLVLVLFASVVFINWATVQPNYRTAFEAQKNQRLLSDQSVRFQKLATEKYKAERDEAFRENRRLENQIADIRANKVPDTEELRTAALIKELEKANAGLQTLNVELGEAGQRNGELTAQLDKSRLRIDELQKERATTAGEVTDLVAKLERSERIVRALQLQLRDKDEKIADLEAKVARGPAVAGDGEAVQPITDKIAGTITAVQGELASINIGTAHGVIRGLKLMIYRDASFVGYLRIDEVDEAESAGTIVDKQLDPVAGDKVTNDLLK